MASTFGTPFAPKGTTSGGIPVGGSMLCSDRGSYFVASDKTEWIRSGSAIRYNSKYRPVIDKFPALRVFANTNIQVASSTYSSYAATIAGGKPVATNFNGTIILGYGGNNGASVVLYFRSTDGGNTWNNITSSTTSTHYIKSIVWTGDRFIAAASTNTASATSFYHSTDGSSWTAGTVLSTGSNGVGVSLCTNTVNGTVVAYTSTYSSKAFYRCTTGSTFTAATTGSGGATDLPHLLAGNNSKYFGLTTSNGYYWYSTDDGVNWSTNGSQANYSVTQDSSVIIGCVSGTFFILSPAVSSIVYTTTTPETPSSWVQRSISTNLYLSLNSGSQGFYNSDKTMFYLPHSKGFLYTKDAINWDNSWVSTLNPYSSTTPYYLPILSNNGAFILHGTAAYNNINGSYFGSLNSPTYVGNTQDIKVSAGTNNYLSEYIRIY